LWNEPNWCGLWTGTTAEMVRMASDAYHTIKSIDPNAIVLTPAPAGSLARLPSVWMADYLSAGGGKFADVVTFHGPDPYRSTAVAENIVPIVESMRAVLLQNGQSNKPLWDTEGNWGRTSNLPDQDQQAAFLARFFILHTSSGVGRLYWYNWNNPEWGTLWQASSGLRKAAAAYRETFNWLTGATMQGPCSTDDEGTWTCKLTRPRGYRALIVWNPRATVALSAPQYQIYRTLNGDLVPLAKSVTVGPKPILLERSENTR